MAVAARSLLRSSKASTAPTVVISTKGRRFSRRRGSELFARVRVGLPTNASAGRICGIP